MPFLAYDNLIIHDGKDIDYYALSFNAFFLCVHAHYALLCAFTTNWTWWTFFSLGLSYSMFFPLFQFIFDRTPTDVEYMLDELAYSNFIFWEI
jgi:hypothetical protein